MHYIAPGYINGTIQSIGSKSYAQRAILLSPMVNDIVKINNVSNCMDNNNCIELIRALGAQVDRYGNNIVIKGGYTYPANKIYCGESGFCFRAASSIIALSDRKIKLIPCGSLINRPLNIIFESLSSLGVRCKINHNPTCICIHGPIVNTTITVDCSISSQILSGLLLALPNINKDSEIYVTNLYSSDYIKMTLYMLSAFGINVENNSDLSTLYIQSGQKYSASQINIEGDWSCSAFLLVAGAIAGSITVYDLNKNSIQCDKRILEVLENVGAKVVCTKNSVKVVKNNLRAFEFDATRCPDLFPPLAALACCIDGTSKIIGTNRLRFKESDRKSTLISELSSLGVKIKTSKDDIMEITGGNILGGTIDSHNDHRIAMAGAIVGLQSRYGVYIINEACVSKSYPDFFEDLQSIWNK